MIKFIQTLRFQVGDKVATFTGRDSLPVDDETKKALLPIGVFTEQADGELVYSAKIGVAMADGTERNPDARGFIACAMSDLANPDTTAFR